MLIELGFLKKRNAVAFLRTLYAPSDLIATATSSSEIVLAWVDNSADETGFEIWRSPDGTTSWTQIDSVAADVTSYTDSGLSFRTSYYYRVRGSGVPSGDTAFSNVAGATTWGLILYAAGDDTFVHRIDPFTAANISVLGATGVKVTGLAIDPTTGIMYGATARDDATVPAYLIGPITSSGTSFIGSFGLGGVNWTGPWNSATAYNVNDVVSDAGTFYKCISANTNNEPPNATYWSVLTGGMPDTMDDIAFTSDGVLWGISNYTAQLYTINKSTGTATQVGSTGFSSGTAYEKGLAADSSDTLYCADAGTLGQLSTLDKTTGTPTNLFAMSGVADASISALAFTPNGELYAVHADDVLAKINLSTGVITDIGTIAQNALGLAFKVADS